MSENKVEHLITEYSEPFASLDDVTLARWLSQTLGQLRGKYWRMSHPLINTYRFAAKVAHRRQIWLKRLANPPPEYSPADCCRAPLLVIFSRDILKSGFVCAHCEETALSLEDLPARLQENLRSWAVQYEEAHAVAHWTDEEQKEVADYEQEYRKAQSTAKTCLQKLEDSLLEDLLDILPAFAWEDQDECLEVEPDDIKTRSRNKFD